MNKEQFKGNWNQIRGKVKESFGKLTDNDIAVIDGKRDQLVGAIQKKYGCSKEKAEADLRKFEDRLADLKVIAIEKVEELGFDVPQKKTGTENR